MTRAVKTGELFATFKFDGKDCADMGIYNVTSGSTYTMNIEPTFSDNKLEVPAYDGKYYYGTQITGQQFQFNCFCHDLVAQEYDAMRAWLHPRKIGRLILSDQPYKYYIVKVVSISTLGAYPLTTIQTPQNTKYGRYAVGDVVYTGNFTVTFETVGSAYGYGLAYYRDDLIYDAKKVYGMDYYYNSGLLYRDMCPAASWKIDANASGQLVPLYNPGSAANSPKYLLEHEGTFAKNSFIQFTNASAGTSTVIDLSNLKGNIIIDTSSQTIQDEDGIAYYGRFSGTLMSINPYTQVIEIPETWVENIEDTTLIEYDSFYIEDNLVTINPKVLTVNRNMEGQYFCVHGNGGSKILTVDEANNSLILDANVYTADIPAPQIVNGVVVRPAGFEYNYIEVGDVMPTTGKEGDVCVVNGTWYTYVLTDGKTGEWKWTTDFSSKEEFKDAYGDYVPVYRVFGANIVELDVLTITTGTNVKYKENNITKTGASIDAFQLSAEMMPRYL